MIRRLSIVTGLATSVNDIRDTLAVIMQTWQINVQGLKYEPPWNKMMYVNRKLFAKRTDANALVRWILLSKLIKL